MKCMEMGGGIMLLKLWTASEAIEESGMVPNRAQRSPNDLYKHNASQVVRSKSDGLLQAAWDSPGRITGCHCTESI